MDETNKVSAVYQNTKLTDLAGKLYSATKCNVTVSHTEMQCSSRIGVGQYHRWRMTVGSQQGSRSNVTTSYEAPTVDTYNSQSGFFSMRTRGGELVTLRGKNFGPVTTAEWDGEYVNPVTVQYAHTLAPTYTEYVTENVTETKRWYYDAVRCNVTEAHVTMECTTVPGVGHEFRWEATVGDQVGPRSNVNVSYTAPYVARIDLPGDGIPAGAKSGPSVGGTVVDVHGTNFGTDVLALYNVKNATIPINGSECDIIVHDHEYIRCVMPPAPGDVYPVDLEVGEQTSNVSMDAYFYCYEGMYLLPSYGPIRGGTTIRVIGESLVHDSPFVRLRLGSVESSRSDSRYDEAELIGVWDEANSSYVFQTPNWAQGQIMVPKFSLNNVSWTPITYSNWTYYENPTVSKIEPTSGPVTGDKVFYVTGTGFAETGFYQGRFTAHDPYNTGHFVNREEEWLKQDRFTCERINSTRLACTSPTASQWWYNPGGSDDVEEPRLVDRSLEFLAMEFTIDDVNYNPSANFTSQGLTFYTYTDPVITVNSTTELKRFAVMLEGSDYYTRETFTFETQEKFKKAISLAMDGKVSKDDGKRAQARARARIGVGGAWSGATV